MVERGSTIGEFDWVDVGAIVGFCPQSSKCSTTNYRSWKGNNDQLGHKTEETKE